MSFDRGDSTAIPGVTSALIIEAGGTGASTAAGARANLGLGTAATTDSTAYAPAAQGVTNGNSHDHNGGDGAQIAYSSLSGTPTLGTIASQNANNVSITGGSVTGITDLAVADGGTGASTAQNARINLLPSYTGNASKVLAVNTGATDVEWVTAGTGGGGVTSVTATSPVASSGGTTPVISLNSAYGDTLNPYGSKTANFVLAAPNGSAGSPTFRAIVAADIPTLNQNTTGTASNVTGTVAVANGGTGATTLTSNNVILGNGTSAVQFVAPGTSGNVLTSNGTTWTSAAAPGAVTTQTYDTPGTTTWTKPASANWVLIQLWGGGGGGGRGAISSPGGGGGGGACNSILVRFSDLVGTVSYTVAASAAGATSTSTAGTNGNVSSVTMNSFAGGANKTIYAYGGVGGGATNGGGGGGIFGLGTTTTGGSPHGSGTDDPGFGGGNGSTSSSTPSAGGNSVYGGGGGGGSTTNTGNNGAAGGSSIYGGGAGGGGARAGGAGLPGAGGGSLYGGNGGAGSEGAGVAATAGTQPGGGGGGAEDGNGGAGAAGRVQFIYW